MKTTTIIIVFFAGIIALFTIGFFLGVLFNSKNH